MPIKVENKFRSRNKNGNRKTRQAKKARQKKKKTKLTNKLNIGDRVLVLAERLKKKMHLENFVKVQKFSKKSIMTNYF